MTCKTANCGRTTDWLTDGQTRAAYCRDCTGVVMATGRPPELPVFVPAWRKHLVAKDLTRSAA